MARDGVADQAEEQLLQASEGEPRVIGLDARTAEDDWLLPRAQRQSKLLMAVLLAALALMAVLKSRSVSSHLEQAEDPQEANLRQLAKQRIGQVWSEHPQPRPKAKPKPTSPPALVQHDTDGHLHIDIDNSRRQKPRAKPTAAPVAQSDDDGQRQDAGVSRHHDDLPPEDVLLVPTAPATPTGCSDPICRIKTWDGWSTIFPWLQVPATSTTTTTTTTQTTTSTGTTTTLTRTQTITAKATTTTRTSRPPTRRTATTSTTSTVTSTSTTGCETAVPNHPCYDKVHEAMGGGPVCSDLDTFSTFEDFQMCLNQFDEGSKCPLPCKCHTASPGEPCYQSTIWAMNFGIAAHPGWYPNVNEDSTFEEVQLELSKDEDSNSSCATPCTPRTWAKPSLFCFSIIRKDSYETEIMRAQLKRGTGIFECDGYAVLSSERFTVGTGPGYLGEISTLQFKNAEVGTSKDGTAANTLLFMRAWEAIRIGTPALRFDWTVKVDPDAVIIAQRLRWHLEPHTGKRVYVRNCNKVPDSGDFPMMFGSLEVLSKDAMRAYFESQMRCKTELDWKDWGEDYWLGHCLDLVGVDKVDDFTLISDGVCTGVDCHNGDSAAFHPFKTEDDWLECWRTAMR